MIPAGYQSLAIALALLASHWGAYQHGQSVADTAQRLRVVTADRDIHAANLSAFVAESNRLHGLALQLDTRIETLAAAQPKIIERWRHETKINPVPADCRPGPERLRIINDAIDAANLAAGAGNADQALPADRTGDGR